MNSYDVNWAIRNRAIDLGMRRSGSMGHRDTENSKSMMRHRGKPPWWRHYIGAMGEIIFSLYSGLQVDETTIGRGDDGSDFPGGIQVKSTDLEKPPNLLFLKSQWERKHAHARIFVLIWIDEPQAHILGAITKERAWELKKEVELGQGPTYRVWRNLLLPVEQFIPPAVSE